MSTPSPNLLLIGAQKAATTAIWYQLCAHPDIYMYEGKELHFFGVPDRYALGHEYYLEHFRAWRGERWIGDGTPVMHQPEAATQIGALLPDAHLLACLRDPIERAYSTFQMQAVKGSEPPGRSFEEAVARDPSYLANGEYFRQLSSFERHFPRSRMHVLIHRDLKLSPQAAWGAIYAFLEVDPIDPIDRPQSNVGGAPRSVSISRALNTAFRVRNALRRTPAAALLRHPTVDDLSRRVRNQLTAFNRKPGRYPPLDPQVRQRLLPSIREDIERLEEWLDRDLSGWKKE